MHSIPPIICQFIQKHHVVSLACHDQQQIWAASCFYAFDEKQQRLILLTQQNTQHGQIMAAYPIVAGTIAGQPISINEIEGIQFQATARQLCQDEKEQALLSYCQRHPIANTFQSDVWELRLSRIKYTSNRIRFAEKQEWFA